MAEESKQSLTITSLVVLALTLIFEKMGLEIAQSDLSTTVITIVKIASVIGVWFGRWRIGDINWLGRKKSQE